MYSINLNKEGCAVLLFAIFYRVGGSDLCLLEEVLLRDSVFVWRRSRTGRDSCTEGLVLNVID